jgi:hypothetical protein
MVKQRSNLFSLYESIHHNLKKSLVFMKHEVSLLCLGKPALGPYLEPASWIQSTFSSRFNYFDIISPLMLGVPRWSFPKHIQKCNYCTFLHVQHALPISLALRILCEKKIKIVKLFIMMDIMACIKILNVKYKDGCRLGCSTVYSGRSLPTFQRSLLPPSSGPPKR